MDKRRDVKRRAKQGANVWGPGKIRPTERQEKMERAWSEGRGSLMVRKGWWRSK